MSIVEKGKELCYSPEAKRAREREFKGKFGSNVKIYEPANAKDAILFDLTLKTNYYKRQLECTTIPEERRFLKKRYDAAVDQIHETSVIGEQ